MASVALVSLLTLPEPASAQDSVTISISPAGETNVYEGTSQTVKVSGFIPGGSAAARWVRLDLVYFSLSKDDISLQTVPPPASSSTSNGPIDAVIWTLGKGATTFSFELRVTALSDEVLEVAQMLQVEGSTKTVGKRDAIESNTITLNVEDNDLPDFGQNSTTLELDENTPEFRDFDSPVSATDRNGHDLVYTLSGTDAAFFGIRPNGRLFPRRVFDYESKSEYEVTVTATDPAGATDTITVSIEIEDVDEPPDFDTDSPTLTVDENIATDTTAGKTVGSPVTATDPEGSTVSYSLGGTDVGSFAIDSTSGQITTAAQLDRETQAEHSVTVTASDPNGNSSNNDVTITLTNVNEPPAYATATTSFSIVENTAGPIGPVTPNDVDDSSHSYELTGADASWFTIDGSGRITPAAGVNLDYENRADIGGTSGDNAYDVTVTATDPGGLSDTISVEIRVENAASELPLTPLPGAPPLNGNHTGSGDNPQAELTTNWIAPDNAGRPDIMGYDVEYRRPVSTASWSLQTADAGDLTATVSGLDFNSEYEARVRAVNEDGAGPWLHLGTIVAAKFTTLRPRFFPENYALAEADNPTDTVLVFMTDLSDRDFTLPVGIRLTGSSFEEGDIVVSDTELNFVSGDGGDPNNPVKTFTITAQRDDDTSNETLSLVFQNPPQGVSGDENSAGVTITDPDVNSPPFFTQGSVTRSVDENAPAGIAIGSPVTATDNASGKTGDSTTLTYALAGTGASSFTIGSSSGQISTSAALDYSTKNVYSVAVTVHDGKDRDGTADTSEDARIDVTINVLDLDNEAPGTPAAPSVTPASSISLTVTWSAPTNTGPPITDYNVRYRVADNGSTFTDAGHSGTSTTATLSDLFTTTKYDVQVQAVNDEGTGDWSVSGQGTTGLIPLDVSYESDSYETVENGLVAARLQLDQRANRQIEVPISVTPASGTDTGDYTVNGLTNDRLTFEAGTMEKVFTVSANQDGDHTDEAVDLTIDADGLPGGVTAATRSTSRVVIRDLPTVGITSAAAAPVTEAFTVTIVFSEDVTGFEVGEIEVDNGTASDLNPTAGPASTYTVTITPTATGDVTVTVPAGVAEDADGNASQAADAFTIAAGFVELTVSFEQAEYEIREGQGADIEVEVSPAADRRVEVPLVVALQGGATDEDYSGVPAKLVIEEGESQATIAIKVLADEVNDPGEGMVLSFGELPVGVISGDPSSTQVHFTQQRTAEQFSQTLEVMLAVLARSTAASAQSAIQGRFERHRQWSRLGSSGAMQGSGTSEASASAAEPTQGSWLRSFSLGSLGSVARSGESHSGVSPGYGTDLRGSVYGQDRLYGSGIGDASLGSGLTEYSGMRDQGFNLAGTSFEMPLGKQEQGKSTSWVPVLWGQGDLQHFNGDLDRLGMNYRGRLEAAHVGLDLYANDQVLAGLSFMRSWGDMDYTDDGVDGVLGSDLNTFHPYLYWEPNERVSMWGFGGMGWGEVDVKELGRTHDFDADFRMLAGGVRSVLCRWPCNELALRVDAFTAQLRTDATDDITKVSGEAHRGRLMLEWVHDLPLAAGRSLSLQLEAGGRFDGGDADRGAGVETGFRLRYLDASCCLDVALNGRTLVVHESDYRDWGLGVQASWDPGEKQRGFRASVMSMWGQDGGGRTTLWDNADAVMLPAGLGAMGMSAQYRMESEMAYAGMMAPGVPGLLKPYARLRWAGQGRELAVGTAWSLSAALPAMLELEAMRRTITTGPADLGVLLRVSIPSAARGMSSPAGATFPPRRPL